MANVKEDTEHVDARVRAVAAELRKLAADIEEHANKCDGGFVSPGYIFHWLSRLQDIAGANAMTSAILASTRLLYADYTANRLDREDAGDCE